MLRIKVLDSIRGAAALSVLFHHLFTRFPLLFSGKFPAWLQTVFVFISDMNVEAVLLFFFLSGCSICLSLKNDLPVNKINFNTYAYRRLKRILPLYYLAIFFTFICGLIIKSAFIQDDFSLKNFLGNIFFLQCSKSYKGNWFAPYGDNGPLWSLSFEMFYYFFLPVFLYVMLRLNKSGNLTMRINRQALVVAFLISYGSGLINKYYFIPFIAFASLFYVWYGGFFIAVLYLKRIKNNSSDVILQLLLTILAGAIYYVYPTATCHHLFVGSAMAALFYWLYLLKYKFPQPIFSSVEKIFNFLFYKIGRGSYALYLLHYPLLMVLKQYTYLTLSELIIAMIVLTIYCVYLEKYFMSKKYLFLKLQYLPKKKSDMQAL